MTISPLAYNSDFFRPALFLEKLLSSQSTSSEQSPLQSNYANTIVNFSQKLFLQKSSFFELLFFQKNHFFIAVIFSEQLLFKSETFAEQLLLENRQFFQDSYFSILLSVGELVQKEDTYIRATFFEAVTSAQHQLFRKSNFAKVITVIH